MIETIIVREPEFKKDFEETQQKCREFAVTILNSCRNSAEVEMVLDDPGLCKEYEDKRSMYLEKYGSKCYAIYVYEKSSEDIYHTGVGGFYAASCSYDLGKLSHIESMGIDVRKQVV